MNNNFNFSLEATNNIHYTAQRVAAELNTDTLSLLNLLLNNGFPYRSYPDFSLSENEYEFVESYLQNNVLEVPMSNPFKDLEELIVRKNKIDKLPDNQWKVGKVKFVNPDKGFGFITCWNDNQKHFFHISNVLTNPIVEGQLVVYKLEQSHTYNEKLSAKAVSLISIQNQNVEYLIEVYTKYDNLNDRLDIIYSLPEETALVIIGYEIRSILVGDEGLKVSWIDRTLKILQYNSLRKQGNLPHGIDVLVSKVVNKYATPEVQIELWIKKPQHSSPSNETIEICFLNTEPTRRPPIFSRIDGKQKRSFLQKLISFELPEQVLYLLSDHLMSKKGYYYHSGAKSILSDKDIWQNEDDFELYTDTVKYYQQVLDQNQKLALFVKGYFDMLPIDNVLSNISELTRENINFIFESHILSEEDSLQLISNLLIKELNSGLNIYSEYFYFKSLVDDRSIEDYLENKENINCMYRKDVYSQKEPFYWIFKLAEQYLSEKQYSIIEFSFIDKVPGWFHFVFWEEGYCKTIPTKYIVHFISINEEAFSLLINKWEKDPHRYHISKNSLIEIFKQNILELNCIETRQDFLILYNNTKTLRNLKVDNNTIAPLVDHKNICFFEMINWIEGLSEDFDFELYKTIFIFLSTELQIKFFRKMFWLANNGKLTITVEKLNQLISFDRDLLNSSNFFSNDIPIDISLYIVIESINSFVKKGNLLLENELLIVVLKSLSLNKKYYFQISALFQECPGRYEAIYNWKQRKLSNVITAIHTDFCRNDIPKGIKFCEGRLANVNDKYYNVKFWWCCNKPCYSNAETTTKAKKWQSYTLLDFLLILGFDLDDGNRVEDSIERGKYYQFISTVNRFNRLLKKMYCSKCGHILSPVEDSHFAHYRVVRFSCENHNCEEYHNEIYLHHCLNARCKEIIDSRVSKKCSNGLYICSNLECGSCCSDEMFKRRLNNLTTVDNANNSLKQSIISDLEFKIKNNHGHLERGAHFCFKCGKKINVSSSGTLKCSDCDIEIGLNKL